MDMVRVPSIDNDPVKIHFNDVQIHTDIYRKQKNNREEVSVDSDSLKLVFKKFELNEWYSNKGNTSFMKYDSTLEIDISYDKKNKKWIVTQSQS